MLAVAADPAVAQTSSVRFQTLNGTVQNLSPGNGQNQGANGGEFTFGDGLFGMLPVNRVGDFFLGIFGLNFVSTPSLTYDKQENTTTYNLNSFYFTGSCSICGSSNAFPVVTTTLGNTLAGPPPENNKGQLIVSAGPAPIDFGNGHSGVISFGAGAVIANNQDPQFRFGDVSFQVLDSNAKVPGPLPLLGAAAAFGFSRKLRRRVAAAR
jgi:hypothetical protein